MNELKGHILVVDDHRTNRLKISLAVKRLGYSADVAENGRQALDMLRTQAFDLVLLDIIMPEMDGHQVLAEMKADHQLRNIPVIVISAEQELDSVVQGIELGAEDYLPKAFDPILLKARINASLEKKRWRDKEQAYLAQIETEREKADNLLLNILPKPIAERLKQGPQTIVDNFSSATILFADLVGFTDLSARIAPLELISLLNELFSTFDYLAEKYRLEKIKTIGDSYMVVGGIPEPSPGHAQAIADMALEMQAVMTRFNADSDEPLGIRIGINTGPVIAGVIGSKKFIYDLWGDAVNTASRMESHGQAGKIHISANTYNALRHTHTCTERGSIEVKGKGTLQTYFLTGRKEPEACLTSQAIS